MLNNPCNSTIYFIMFQINAVATLSSVFIPAFFPKCHKFQEMGSLFLPHGNYPNLMIVSPDGLITCSEGCGPSGCDNRIMFPTGNISIEIKSPYTPIENKRMLPVHYNPPYYYCSQILSQQYACDTPMSLYVSCSPDSMVVTLLDHKERLWTKLFNTACIMYAKDPLSKPQCLPDHVSELKEDLKAYCEDVELVAELPMIKGIDSQWNANQHMSNFIFRKGRSTGPRDNIITNVEYINTRIIDLCTQSIRLIESAHQLERRRASEVLLFVATDSDRQFNKDKPSSVPIAYALKGRSIRNSTGRKMINLVRDRLKANNTNVLCEAVDGQWSGLVFRNENSEPLTLFELQRDIWTKFKKMSKDKLLDYINTMSSLTAEELQYCQTIDIDQFGVHTLENCEISVEAIREQDRSIKRKISFFSLTLPYNQTFMWRELIWPQKHHRPDLWNIDIGIKNRLTEILNIDNIDVPPFQDRPVSPEPDIGDMEGTYK